MHALLLTAAAALQMPPLVLAAAALAAAAAVVEEAFSSPPQCYSSAGDSRRYPCGPAAQRCSQTGWPAEDRPVYHVKDLTCGESDPNGPFWDAKHGMYHLFYQVSPVSLANAAVPNGGGPLWGHAVSRNLIHFAHMPVAMWNDRWYDDVALFSGSASQKKRDQFIDPECALEDTDGVL